MEFPDFARRVQSSKMVHAALLLLMLGARTTVTPFHHQPEAQHLKSSAIHKLQADYPIFWHKADMAIALVDVCFRG
jgi:hypothetical protein